MAELGWLARFGTATFSVCVAEPAAESVVLRAENNTPSLAIDCADG